MSHKTMIDGVAYEISGGKTLVGGTAYSIDKGKTLVGGTAYEVGFAQPATITITGNGGSYYAYATIDGTRYGSATTLEVPVGTIITCHIYNESDSFWHSYISVNGNEVFWDADGTDYNYTVVGDVTINLGTDETGKYMYGYIEITEE